MISQRKYHEAGIADCHKGNLWHVFHQGLDNWSNLLTSLKCQAWFQVLAHSMGITPLSLFPTPVRFG